MFGWLGSEYSPDPPVVGMAAADAAKQCLASFALTAVGTNANVTLVLEGEESDQFWEVFDY